MNSTDARRESRILAYVGHELRNPLTAAMLSVSVVREMVDDGDPRIPHLSQALNEMERVSGLLTSLLRFGRAGAPAMARMDLVRVVRAVEKRVHLERLTVIAPETLLMEGDQRLLEQAVENLVCNSTAAGAKSIEIMVDREPGEIILHIEDDGPGVPANLEERIFKPLVSGRGSTGLGLALAREVIEAHGGSLTLLPTSSGALFRISLPVTV